MNLSKWIFTIVIFLVWIGMTALFAKIYLADVENVRARDLLANGKFAQALESANRSVLLNPNEPSYYRIRAKTLLSSSLNQDKKTRDVLKMLALEDFENGLALNPKNLATIRNSTSIYYFLAIDDLAKPAGLGNLDPKYLKVTSDYIAVQKNVSPNDVGMYVLMAEYEKRLGLDEEFEQSVEIIRVLRPDLLEWHSSFTE